MATSVKVAGVKWRLALERQPSRIIAGVNHVAKWISSWGDKCGYRCGYSLLVGAIILWFCSWMGIAVPGNVQKGYIAVVALIGLYMHRRAAVRHTIGSHHRRGWAAAGMIDYSALLYDPIYAELGVPATLTTADGGEVESDRDRRDPAEDQNRGRRGNEQRRARCLCPHPRTGRERGSRATNGSARC